MVLFVLIVHRLFLDFSIRLRKRHYAFHELLRINIVGDFAELHRPVGVLLFHDGLS